MEAHLPGLPQLVGVLTRIVSWRGETQKETRARNRGAFEQGPNQEIPVQEG